MQRSLLQGRVSSPQARTLSDSLSFAVFLLDHRGYLTEANQSARTLLRQGNVLRYVGGRIAAVDRDSDRLLAAAIGAWTAGSAGGPLPLRAVGDAAARHFAFAVSPPDTHGDARSPGCLLIVCTAAGAPQPAQLKRIPPRLRSVFELLLAGSSAKEIAEALQVTHATARTYVTRLYVHLELRGRAELWRRYGGRG